MNLHYPSKYVDNKKIKIKNEKNLDGFFFKSRILAQV